jgi:UV DNA damage repair endonuclease
MGKRQGNKEELADNPVKLTDTVKSRLTKKRDEYGLTYSEAVSILLDIADRFGKDIEIQTKPSVTIKGS